jgi:dTMP kinase
LAPNIFAALEQMVVAPTCPDLTVVLDVPPETGLQRALDRRLADAGPDAYEGRDLAYHQRLRQGFAAIARTEPRRCRLVDGAREPVAVAAEVWGHVRLLAGAE